MPDSFSKVFSELKEDYTSKAEKKDYSTASTIIKKSDKDFSKQLIDRAEEFEVEGLELVREFYNKAKTKRAELTDPEYEIPDKCFNSNGNLITSKLGFDFSNHLIQKEMIRHVKGSEQSQGYSELWVYDPESKTWIPEGEQKLKEKGRKYLQSDWTNALKSNVINHLESSRPVELSTMGLRSGEIALNNGILEIDNLDNKDIHDLQTREIKPEDYVVNRINAEWKEDLVSMECPNFIEFLENVIPEEKQRKKLQEYVGYTLKHWDRSQEKAMLFLGESNRGKGLLLDVIEEFLGKKNVCSHPLDFLAHEKWGRKDLGEHLANINHDLDASNIQKQGKAKQLLSCDPITGHVKHKDPFKLQPRAVHYYSANQPPLPVKKDDMAYYNRFLTIVFREYVEEYDSEKVTRKELKEEMTTKEEMNGILRWAILGLKRLEEQGSFTGEVSKEQTRQLWSNYNESIEEYKKELDFNKEYKYPTNKLYERYKEWCESEPFLETLPRDEFKKVFNRDPNVRITATTSEYVNSTEKHFMGVKPINELGSN